VGDEKFLRRQRESLRYRGRYNFGRMKTQPSSKIEAQLLPPIVYAVISAVGLLCAVGLLFFFVHNAPDLRQNGISKPYFYVLLMPLAFSAAAFLFGAMRAYGTYRGKVSGGALEISGPIVAAALVVVGGISIIQSASPPPSFFMQVRFTDPDGAPVLSGEVTLEARTFRYSRKVSDGEVTFPALPYDLFRRPAAVRFDSSDFHSASNITLDNENPPTIKLQRTRPDTLPPVTIPVAFDITSETVESKEAAGWGTGWSPPQVACTTDKPEGWTIARIYDFHLISSTERSECGKWTTCGGEENDTPRRACRTIAVQGHNENRYDGWGRAVAVFHVDWKHPR
jgi:hypothetical protein